MNKLLTRWKICMILYNICPSPNENTNLIETKGFFLVFDKSTCWQISLSFVFLFVYFTNKFLKGFSASYSYDNYKIALKINLFTRSTINSRLFGN